MTVSAVIPIRYVDCFDQSGAPRMVLAGRQLWEITLRQAVRSKSLKRTVVAYDDPRFLPHLEPWRENVVLCQRPPELSAKDATTLDVLAFVAGWLDGQGQDADYLMLLEITHPLRPQDIIDDMVAAAARQDADSLVTCHPVHYNYWRRSEGQRVSRIIGTGENTEVALYEELVGICSLFRPQFLGSDNPFGEHVDIVPIDRFWATVDVRDENGCWLAEQYLKRLNISL